MWLWSCTNTFHFSCCYTLFLLAENPEASGCLPDPGSRRNPLEGRWNIDKEFQSISKAVPGASSSPILHAHQPRALAQDSATTQSLFSKQGLMTIAVISNYGKGRISPKGLIFCHDWIKKGGSCWDWKRSLSHIGWWRNQRSCHPRRSLPCQVTELSLLASVTARSAEPRARAAPPSSAGINCLFNKWC